MTDDELLSVLTLVPRSELDPETLASIHAAERDGVNVTVYAVAGLASAGEEAPLMIVVHVPATPSIPTLREGYARLVEAFGEER